jgi:hypothetical protein
MLTAHTQDTSVHSVCVASYDQEQEEEFMEIRLLKVV